jgi:hypothetical protein
MKNILFSPAFVKFIPASDAIDSPAGLWYDQNPSQHLACPYPSCRKLKPGAKELLEGPAVPTNTK